MKAMKTLVVIALSVCMVFTMMPLGSIQAMAIDEPQQAEQQETTAPDGGNGQGSDVSPGESKGDPQEGDSNDDGNGTDNGNGTDDDEGTVTDDPAVNDEPLVQDEAPILKAPSRALKSGDVGNGWKWVVTGEDGNYTLTFEYTGSADTPPTFEVPNNFISTISSDLGDIGKNDIKEIVIPERCTRIGTYAFQDMDGIKRVEIASTVKTIDNVAFGDNNANNDTDAPLGCGNLEEVVIRTNDSGKSELTTVGARAFNGCKKLKTIQNLDKTNLTQIGYGAFMNVAVEHFYIPDTVRLNTSSTYNMQYAFARNSSLKSISMPAPFYLYSSQTYTLAYCPNLETVEFRTIEGAALRDETNALPANFFNSDQGLKELDLSAYDKAANSTTTFNLSDSVFTNTALTDLEVIKFPKNRPVSIGTNTFKGKHFTSLEGWENVKSIRSIGTNAFNSSRLISADLSEWTGLTSIGETAFRNCESMTELVIPENVTTIGTAAFKNCDNLKTVTINAKQLTNVSETNLFHGDDNLESVTISNNTKKINGNVLASIPADADTFFQGENVIEITKATKKGGSKPIKDLNGTYYVDPQGVLYKLNDNGKASLAYIPPGISSYTVPETIRTPGDEGAEYTVTAVEANALNHAHELTAIDFAAPQNVYLKTSAFTGWSTSTDNKEKTVQGKDAIDVGQWAKVSTMCDFPIGNTTGKLVKMIKETYPTPNGKEVSVIVAVNDKLPSADNTYDYKTGQQAGYTISISNGDKETLNKAVRIYFSYSDDGYNMGSFPEGNYNIKNSFTGTIYPMKVVQTDNPNVYYYEITGILPGETLTFTNDIMYPAMETGGGEVKIWTQTLSPEDAAANEGEVINPGDYIELDWLTSPVTYSYTKANANVYDTSVSKSHGPIIMTDPSGDAYVSSIAYRLKETNTSGSSSTTEGTDYIRWVNYSDEITLPEELYWRPEIINALNIGLWNVEDVSGVYYDGGNSAQTFKAITVPLGSKKYYLAYLNSTTGYGIDSIDNLKVEVVDNKKLKLTWKVANTSLKGASAANEYSVQSFYLRIGENVVLADLDKVNDLLDANPGKKLTELLKIHNETDEVRHYSYSPNQTAGGEADNPVDASYDVQISKAWQKNNNTSTYTDGGKDDFFSITINNTGIMNLKNWGKATKNADGTKTYDKRVVDDNQLSDCLYIEPANIQKMLNATATLGSGKNAGQAPIGDWLTITITKASLYTPGQYQPVEGTDQTNKYDINVDLYHSNDNGMRVNEAAKFVIKKNSAGQITVTLSGDTIAENNKTYVIGEGGDYANINALFTAIGYFPTRNTKYSLTYDVKGDFTLKPGQKLVFPILTTFKTTPMMLTKDTRDYLSSYSYANNTATVSLQAGTDISKTYSPPVNHRWDEELILHKYGYYTSGSAISDGATSVKDGTAVASTLSFFNQSGKAYAHMDLADTMTGAQVALVPVAQNPDLADKGLETYTDNGTSYYLLNKPGTYNNVVFGRYSTSDSTSERNATQNWKADITVTETTSGGKRTSLNTRIKWQSLNNWGGTSTWYYMHYKSLVSATKAGLAGADNPSEQKEYKLDNKAWLGDHQGHRLYDKMGYYFQVYGFSKYIVSEDGKGDGTDSTTDGTLVNFSRVRQSEKVTYQITIRNNSTSPTVLNGSRMYDNLPTNMGKFSWTKGANVTNLRYYGSDGVEIKYGSGADAVNIPANGQADGHWSIGNTSTAGQQQIKWDNQFNVHFPVQGSLKILVDLEFPARTEGASVWDQYVSEVAGKQLEMTPE